MNLPMVDLPARVVSVAAIQVGQRFRVAVGDVTKLATSIAKVGLLHPILVTPDLHLAAGRRRLAAIMVLGWTEIPVRFVPGEMLRQVEWDENAHRLDLTPSERVALANDLERLATARADARRKAGNARGGKSHATADSETTADSSVESEVAGILPATSAVPPIRARDEVAAKVGTGERSLKKAREVCEAALLDPKTFGRLVEQMDRTGNVNGAWTEMRRLEQADQIERRAVEPPTGEYDLATIDPPWLYDEKLDDRGLRGGVPYTQMTIEQIIAVAPPLAANAIAALWTTNAMLIGGEALRVLAAWGLTPKGLITWDKEWIGAGHWLRNVTEHCILAVRGKPVVRLTTQTTLIRERRRAHSQKPDAFYKMIEELCPGRRLEMYARAPRAGWDVHGLEVRS